jgi:hypothetical protein
MNAHEPILVSSIGSSCSTDQLPIYDCCQSFFRDSDILPHFSSYTPMHDQLVISCNQAKSTMCSKFYTTIIVSLGGGSVDYWLEPQTSHNQKTYDASRAVTRTWEGDSFSLGWNSGESLIASNDKHTGTIRVRPGDVLVIPQQWWFQSQATHSSASISVHSKRCSSTQFSDLILHVLGKEDGNLLSANDEEDVKVQKLFECIRNL